MASNFGDRQVFPERIFEVHCRKKALLLKMNPMDRDSMFRTPIPYLFRLRPNGLMVTHISARHQAAV